MIGRHVCVHQQGDSGLSVICPQNWVTPEHGLNETIDYTASADASGPDQAAVIMGLVHSNHPPQVIAYSANDPTSEVPALEAARRQASRSSASTPT